MHHTYDFLEKQGYVLGLFCTFWVPLLISLILLSNDLYFYDSGSEVEKDSMKALIVI